ncbi:MAG: ATP synthase F1 subunit gamma [Bacteroidales bacterium]
MANLKEIRIRIDSVNSTKQITSAMKMVSAAKLRKAQNAILELRPYAIKLKEILQNVVHASGASVQDNPFSRSGGVSRVLVVMIASNRGLCGAFNSNVSKSAIEMITNKFEGLFAENKVDIITVGKKLDDLLKSKKIKTTLSHHELLDKINFKNVSVLATEIMDQFKSGKYDEVYLVYNEFKNVGVQILTSELFLPVKLNEEQPAVEADYIFEPNKVDISDKLIPYALKIQFYKAILESNAAEHGARMTAMHKATDNAVELLKELRLTYNKARQATITNEILEIVGGAEALKK